MNDTRWTILHFKLIITCKWFWQSDPFVLALGLSWSTAFNSSLDTFIQQDVYLNKVPALLRNLYHQSITGKLNTWVCLGLIHSYGALSFLKIQNSDTGRKSCDKIESVALWIAPSLKMSVLASYLLLAYDCLQRLYICISWRFSWNAHENLSNWHVR